MQDIWLIDVKRQLCAGALQAAYQTALARLGEDKSDANAWGVMASVALEGGRLQKSLELSDKALAFGADAAWVKASRARALLATGRQDEARIIALSVSVDQCETPLEADTIGVILARTGMHSNALPYFEHAVAAEPSRPQFQYNLATSLQFIGRLSSAAAAYDAVLALDPLHHRSRLALVQLRPQNEQALGEFGVLFEQHGNDPDSALLLGHAAARIAEDLGDPMQSLSWLIKAKQAKSAKVAHSRAWVEALFSAAQNAAIRPTFHGSAAAVRPVFVIGMPRSGTTLIDRIISSHPAVSSAGELPDLALLVKRASGSPGPHTLSSATLSSGYQSEFVAAQYQQRTTPLAGNARLLTDKMPFNFFFARHIAESMADAKIIMVRRDPRDTVFANYRQLFATDFGYYDYAYNLDDCAHFVAHFNRLADHWEACLSPDQYTEIHYEDMIADQEQQSRRLIAFLGIEWDDRCLQFHSNASPVATASSVQVRSPIHSGSVARWKQYGDYGARVDIQTRRTYRHDKSYGYRQ